MTIAVGGQLPDMKLHAVTNGEVAELQTASLFAGKTVALFGVPGAFTGTCQMKHVPSYLGNAAALRAKGVDRIVCLAVNDKDVMKAWQKHTGAEADIVFLADGNGAFTKAIGLDADYSPNGMGLRSRRFSMVVKDGVVKSLNLEEPGKFDKSSAETLLTQL